MELRSPASFGIGWFDSLTAIVVALLIIKTAVDIFVRVPFHFLMGLMNR